jgi:hypothetical protein
MVVVTRHRERHREDRYDRGLEINGSPFRVSFINFLQKIVYTNLEDPSVAGEFDVANGHIGSYEPADFILIREVEDHLSKQQRTHQAVT